MFESDVHEQIKELTKRLNTTQASLVNNLVRYALENADLEAFELETAQKRGRKPGSTTKTTTTTEPETTASAEE